MNKIDVSIVIVNYNVKDFLYKCLDSVRKASKNLSVETIVIDNDSSDGSVEYLKPLFTEVNFITSKINLGFGKANNLGFDLAKGKYILILNPDTILEEKTLEVMYNYMEKNPKVGISGCKVLNSDGTFQAACRRGFPTPWASFTKLSGLQSIFPKSKFFGKYNMTYKSTDETYYIDAVIGAFMFARNDVIKELNGFDPEFFMYGEDIDLCYRTQKLGYEVAYVHSTSIIHFKGESTKRSKINEVKHFYEAMKIFATKHYGKYSWFLLFLKLGIFLRSGIAYLERYFKEIAIIILDLLIINFALITGTKFKFGEYFGFPDHAYPTVFIFVSAVVFLSMLFTGEYFEKEHKFTKTTFGYLISFFILSSLTYFFKDYAFSRGVLLWTVGFSIFAGLLLRMFISIFETTIGSRKSKNILLVGYNNNTRILVDKLITFKNRNIKIAGVIKIMDNDIYPENIAELGNISNINEIILKNNIHEVIITDNNLSRSEIINLISEASDYKVRFHVASEYEELIASQTIEEITGEQPGIKKYNLAHFRFRLMKRVFDFILSFFLLTVFLPFSLLFSLKEKGFLKKIFKIFISKSTFVGLYNNNEYKNSLTSLVELVNSESLKSDVIEKINEHYLENYNLSLDFEVMFKYFIRKYSVKDNT